MCDICKCEGELLCCDGPCKRSFHINCLGLTEIPNTEYWYCNECKPKVMTIENKTKSTRLLKSVSDYLYNVEHVCPISWCKEQYSHLPALATHMRQIHPSEFKKYTKLKDKMKDLNYTLNLDHPSPLVYLIVFINSN